MDVDVDLYLAIRLLFTVLALILTSVFMRLRGTEREHPWEPPVAETAWESCPWDQEEGKEEAEESSPSAKPSPTVAEQREESVELSPTAEPSPAAAESIPWQLPTEPHKPEPQEDAGDHVALPIKAEEEDLDSEKEELVMREPASTEATPAPVTSTAASFESSEGFE